MACFPFPSVHASIADNQSDQYPLSIQHLITEHFPSALLQYLLEGVRYFKTHCRSRLPSVVCHPSRVDGTLGIERWETVSHLDVPWHK